jgi:hypothetical protein
MVSINRNIDMVPINRNIDMVLINRNIDMVSMDRNIDMVSINRDIDVVLVIQIDQRCLWLNQHIFSITPARNVRKLCLLVAEIVRLNTDKLR